MQGALCLALALILSVLGFRSTFSYLATLGSPAGAEEGEGDLSQLKSRDRRPKPTRQLERTSIERLSEAKSLSPRTSPPPFFLAGWPDCSRLPRIAHETAVDRVRMESTKPSYLRPSETARLSQVPPPV